MKAVEIVRPAGTIRVSPSALTQVVVQAAEAADGVRVPRPRRGLELAIADGHARVELELAARYGTVVPNVAREVQERVDGALEGMCVLVVDAVDVSIEELDR